MRNGTRGKYVKLRILFVFVRHDVSEFCQFSPSSLGAG